MTPDRFRDLLDIVGLSSQGEAARFLRVNNHMLRRWADGSNPNIPHSVALLLEIMAAYDIKPTDLDYYDG